MEKKSAVYFDKGLQIFNIQKLRKDKRFCEQTKSSVVEPGVWCQDNIRLNGFQLGVIPRLVLHKKVHA